MYQMRFDEFELSSEVLSALSEMGFTEMTPIQAAAIPVALEGRDLIGQAPTGTGKTCAFGIPMIERLDPTLSTVQGLIVCPTRELAVQITGELKKIAKHLPVRFATLYGGQSYDRQLFQLRAKPQIVVATPGRLMDHMRRNLIDLSALRMVVLDEADEMLNMGFREDIDSILESVPEERQTLLFSATLPPEILRITDLYQKDAETVRTTSGTLTVPAISQYYVEVRPRNKADILTRLIDVSGFKLSLIFCNTKRMVDDLTTFLNLRGYPTEALHGDMKQSARDHVMNDFRSGKLSILVATDVAARGIDVDDIDAVFNFDIPLDEEYYVHRIGRTGRANRSGVSFTLCTQREFYRLKAIMRYTKSTIEPMAAPAPGDVERIKANAILLDAAEHLGTSGAERAKEYIRFMLKSGGGEFDEMDAAAALLRHLLCPKGSSAELILPDEPPLREKRRGRDRDRDHDHNREHGREHSREGRRERNIDPRNARLFINIGRMDKVCARDVARLIADHAHIGARSVRNIAMRDKFSFFEVPVDKAEAVINSLKGQTFKDRRIVVDKAK